ncbi:DgyrCDS943 [Dimorphilus gyrociliatus]|uniref:DgyrCDS943 n=1 Tax=Dimorphilus gyrociliatus TaxID=2664684 RepID=A0A7I8V656_9ANNE|nr:DgyrCDS943 [Dimorphilus gyrociliatus]
MVKQHSKHLHFFPEITIEFTDVEDARESSTGGEHIIKKECKPRGKRGRGTRTGSFGKHRGKCCSNSKTALMTNTFPPDKVNIGTRLPSLTSSTNLTTAHKFVRIGREILLINHCRKILEDRSKKFGKIISEAEGKMRDEENRFKTKSKRLKGELIESRAQALKAEEMSHEYGKKRLDLEKELQKERGKVQSLKGELMEIRYNLSRLKMLRHFLFRAAPDWWQKRVFRESGIRVKIAKFKTVNDISIPSRSNRKSIIKERETPSWLRRHVDFQLNSEKSESKDELSLSAFDNSIAATQTEQLCEWDVDDLYELETYFNSPIEFLDILRDEEDSILKLLNKSAKDDYNFNVKITDDFDIFETKKQHESVFQQFEGKNSQLDHLQREKARHFVLYHLEIAKNEIEGPYRELRYSGDVT